MNITRTYLSLLVASITILFSQSTMAMEKEEKAKSCSIMQLQFSNQSEQVASFFFAKGSNTPSVLAPCQSSDPIVTSKNNAIYAHTSAGAWVIEPDQEKDLLTLFKLDATNKEVIKQVPASQAKNILFIVNPQGQAGMFLMAAKEPEVSSETQGSESKEKAACLLELKTSGGTTSKKEDTKVAGVTKGYSIADLIAEHPEKIKLTTQHSFNNVLDLSGLRITSLDGIEKIDPEIKTNTQCLYFYGNQLTSIQSNAFQGFNNLQDLNLANNQLISIQPNTFQALNNLQGLNLSGNPLTSIQPNAFQGLSNLQFLVLHGNQLTSVPANSFQGLNNLQRLYLSGNGNPLASIQPNAFQGLNNLQNLDLRNNKQLASIAANAFQGLDNLRNLYLSYNKLTEEQKQSICDFFRGRPVAISF